MAAFAGNYGTASVSKEQWEAYYKRTSQAESPHQAAIASASEPEPEPTAKPRRRRRSTKKQQGAA